MAKVVTPLPSADTNPLKSPPALYNFDLILRFNSENLSHWKYTEISFGITKAIKKPKTLECFGLLQNKLVKTRKSETFGQTYRQHGSTFSHCSTAMSTAPVLRIF